jgi:uncharacterized protein YqeY
MEDIMTLEKVHDDMIAAMKNRDKPRKEALATLYSAVKKAGIDAGCRDNIPEDMVATALIKEQRAAKEQLDTCPDERTELKAEYQFRYDVISEYCPQMMSAEDIEKYISDNHADLIAGKNKGMIMKSVMPELKGKADGKLINQVVAKLCS